MGLRSGLLPKDQEARHDKSKKNSRCGVTAQRQTAMAEGLVQKIPNHGSERAGEDECGPEQKGVIPFLIDIRYK